MASFNVVGIDELMADLQLEAERIERNGPAAAIAGAQAAIEAMKTTVPVRTPSGGLKDHIKFKGPWHDAVDGHYADVFPTGKNKYGERYETIGYVLEYGRSNMAARSWMRKAMETEGDAIGEKMADVLMRD